MDPVMNCGSCARLESTEINVCRGCGPEYTKWKALEMNETPPSAETQVGGKHYLRAIQPFDIVKVWGLGFYRGNVIKYVLRCMAKNGKEDLMKARHYLDYCIENFEDLEQIDAF